MTDRWNAVAVIVALGMATLFTGCSYPTAERTVERNVTIATWNVRGYPETRQADREWFTRTVNTCAPDVICIQEIANQSKVDTFVSTETHFTSAAFRDSRDGQDNAIFAAGQVTMEDMPDPCGFQHPAQAAYVAYKGFDAVVVTVHLSWTDVQMREQEKALLKNVVMQMLTRDPDVIICGDFNTTEQGIEELADAIAMKVMVPAGQDGVGTTHAGNRYDHFLVSPDLATEEAVACQIQVCPQTDLATAKRVSDHLPVLAVFRTDARYRDRN